MNPLRLAVIVLTLTFALPIESAAVVIRSGCGDASSDFGIECSFAELSTFEPGVPHTIQIDDKIFLGFAGAGFGAFTLDLSKVAVLPFGEGTSEIGLQFQTSELAILPGQAEEFIYGFQVATVDATPRIIGNNLILDEFSRTGEFTSLRLLESVSSDNEILISSAVSGPTQDGQAFPAVAGMSINTNVTLHATFDTAGVVSVSQWRQTFLQVEPTGVPEPSGFFLVSIASLSLLALDAWMRRAGSARHTSAITEARGRWSAPRQPFRGDPR
jgi:hypothetical protein